MFFTQKRETIIAHMNQKLNKARITQIRIDIAFTF